MKSVSILGTRYAVHTGISYQKDNELKGQFGYCSHIEHKIVVGDLSTCETWKNESKEARLAQERLTLRHEIIHAFLNESGLTSSSNGVDCWARNEEMVDWIAIQYPKIGKETIPLPDDPGPSQSSEGLILSFQYRVLTRYFP